MSASRGGSSFYDERRARHSEAKFAVALRAASHLCEGDSLLIDAGTSLTPIAQIIKRLADQIPERTHFTVMTHNYAAFGALVPVVAEARLNVFLTGGRYDTDLNALFGDQAETAYERFHPKWVFVGQNGIDADRGLFCHGNTEELALKRIIFAKPAAVRVIISDHTKLGVPGGLCFGGSDNLTANVERCVLFTDVPTEGPEDNWLLIGGSRPGESAQRFEDHVRRLREIYGVEIVRVRWARQVSADADYVTLTDADTRSSITLKLVDETLKEYAVDAVHIQPVGAGAG